MLPSRASGMLLHPTSLPGPFGVGDLGPALLTWLDTLARSRQAWWQILPLGPTGFGDSPYQCFSAFAGNPLLISPEWLARDGLLQVTDLQAPWFPPDRVDYGPAIDFKNRVLEQAWRNYKDRAPAKLKEAFEHFVQSEQAWLDDFALFMSIKETQQGRSWQDWPTAARRREPGFLTEFRASQRDRIAYHQFRQFLFFQQWADVRAAAHERGVRIIGDIPIFVAGDSADVWTHPTLFRLNADLRPTVVAGVPPDYFNAAGQLWGNPIYDWHANEATGFAWWIARFQATLKLVDVVRLDHFRGFAAYWEIPANDATAINGRWMPSPGRQLLSATRRSLQGLPIIAEDLGLITPEVDQLRQEFHLPGMSVLQFAFGDKPDNRYLPHNHAADTVVYTGTHDNDTTLGWYRGAPEHVRDHVRRYFARDGSDAAWDFLRAAWASVGQLAIAPLQDVMNLGSEARMNFPGKPAGNWGWRLTPGGIQPWMTERLAELTHLYGRAQLPQSP